MRRTAPVVVLLTVLLPWPLPLRPASAEALRVGHVEIRSAPLFSTQEAAQGDFYRALNALHVPTLPDLIRQFLLFGEGDLYVPAKLAESERNLRQLDFLKSVSITPRPPHDGVVDIDVVTQDSWTTDPNGDFSHVRGLTTWQADVTQKNLFGRGAELSATASRDVERTRKAVELSTSDFFEAVPPRWQSRLQARATQPSWASLVLRRSKIRAPWPSRSRCQIHSSAGNVKKT